MSHNLTTTEIACITLQLASAVSLANVRAAAPAFTVAERAWFRRPLSQEGR